MAFHPPLKAQMLLAKRHQGLMDQIVQFILKVFYESSAPRLEGRQEFPKSIPGRKIGPESVQGGSRRVPEPGRSIVLRLRRPRGEMPECGQHDSLSRPGRDQPASAA